MPNPDSSNAQEELAVDIVEVLDRHRKGDHLTYATVLGVLEIIKDMLLDELEEESRVQDPNNNPLFEALAKARHGRTTESSSEHKKGMS